MSDGDVTVRAESLDGNLEIVVDRGGWVGEKKAYAFTVALFVAFGFYAAAGLSLVFDTAALVRNVFKG